MYDASDMRKTLFFYICREIAAPFLLGMAAFTGVLLMGRFLQLADLIVSKGMQFQDILRIVIYLLPFFSMVTIPMSFLLALLLAFGRLSSDSEITAMKSSGISLYNLLPPVFLCGFIAYLASMFITLYALPWGNTSFRKLLVEVIENRATLNLKERVFNDDFPGLVLYVDRYQEDRNVMDGILIQDERDPKEISTIFAREGMIVREPEKKSLRLSLKDGGVHRSVGASGYRLLQFQDYELTINLNQAAKEVTKDESDMTFEELKEKLKTQTEDTKERRDALIEFHRRFALPCACLVFSLLGVPLGIQNQRSGKAAGFAVSIGVILTYYLLMSAGKTFAQRGIIDPGITVWAPNLFFLLVGVYLFKKTATEQPIPLLASLRQSAARFKAVLTSGGGRS